MAKCDENVWSHFTFFDKKEHNDDSKQLTVFRYHILQAQKKFATAYFIYF